MKLYYQRVRARCCPWGNGNGQLDKWTCSVLKGKPPFIEQEAQPNDKPLCLNAECRSPPVSSWASRSTPVLPSGSDCLRVLEYYFLESSEYRFLVCQLYGDYPAKECHHYSACVLLSFSRKSKQIKKCWRVNLKKYRTGKTYEMFRRISDQQVTVGEWGLLWRSKHED